MKSKIKSYIFILILSIIVSIPLFQKDFYISQDDGIQHICRLMGTYQSINERQIFPVIMSAFCNNFGYSWNLFYSPITAYIPLLFRIITDSFVICLKIFMLLVTFFSGISMYEFLNKVTKNKYTGLLGAAIYIFAPYRLTDMYMRIAVAELVSFIFIPMVFHGMFNIFNEQDNDKQKNNKGILLAIGAIGLILSHIVIAMYTAFFAFVYLLINIKKLKNKDILKKLLINLVLILMITSFYLAPLIEHRFSTDYEVFKPGRMERESVLISYKLDVQDLLYTQKGQFATELGFVTIIGFILSIFASRKLEKRYTKIYLFSMFSGIISVILTLKFFPFEKLPGIFTMLQFTFRMLEFSSFFLTTIVAINYSIVIKNFNMKDVFVIIIILILATCPLTVNLRYKDNIKEESLWPATKVTENTKRVHAGCASFEYLPSKAFENLDYIKTREDKIYIISGHCQIVSEQKDGINMQIQIANATENTVLELPYIYYLGYKVTLETDTEKINFIPYESEKGFVSIELDKDISEGTIIVKYFGTNVMIISAIISIIGVAILIIYVKKDNKKQKLNAKIEQGRELKREE